MAVVERKKIGGTCVNIGCIPADAALSNVSLSHYSGNGGFASPVKVDFQLNLKRAKEISQRTAELAQSVLDSLGVELISGTGSLVKGGVKVNGQELEAGAVVIDTGARHDLAPVNGVEPSKVLTVDKFWDLEDVPQRAVVFQGGAPSIRGLEIGQLLAASGAEVTVVDENSSLFPQFDQELTDALRRALENKGLKFDMGAKIKAVSGNSIAYEVEGNERRIEFDAIVPSHAWLPNTEGIGLEQLGVNTNKGFVTVDDRCRTNLPWLYAIGEAASYKGATRSMYMGRAAALNAAGIDFRVNHQLLPSGLYTVPQFAEVGLTEKAAASAGIDYVVGTSDLAYNEKGMALGAAEGLVKLIFDRKGKVLGGGIVGYDAEELASHIALAIKLGATAKDLAYSGYEHATISEAIADAASKALLSLS